ncbi:MAG: iron ABC transporter permease [Alphaproteobacteria bacterium]|nr:iron ABC transporter permease [Alphaproteobacteria bacterium]
MRVKGWLAILATVLVCAGQEAPAQGFAGMGEAVKGFANPDPSHRFAFPADHGAHPDFRIEWWYLTATLTGPDGTDYGAQWTLFRTALRPGEGTGFASPQLWMGHAALTSAERHLFAEKLGRGGVGQAGVKVSPFAAWIDDWQMISRASPGADALSALDLNASGAGFAYRLALEAKGPIVAQGDQGYSVKSAAGQASHYYSQPFYTVTGTITLEGKDIAVTGQAWLDREWSSQPLAPDQTGWDWFSLKFDDGARLMGFRLRDGGAGYLSATWIDADGTPTPMPPGALRLTPLEETRVAGRDIPVCWRVELPQKAVDVTAAALNPQSFMDTTVPYWEGPIVFSGSHTGRGYLEMTGYE